MKHALLSLLRMAVLCVPINLCVMQTSWAEIPQQISYQGILKNADGTLVSDGSYTLAFSLYDAETDGNLLWSEEHTSVAIVDGLYNLILGSVNPLNLAFDSSYWLEMSVDGTTLSPRVALTASAYSLGARVSQTVITNAIDSTHIADGSVSGSDLANNLVFSDTVTLTGLKLTPAPAESGYVLASDATGVGSWQPASGFSPWSVSGSNIFYDGGNVGIGVAAPQEKLQIVDGGAIRLGRKGCLSGAIQDQEWLVLGQNLKAAGTPTEPNKFVTVMTEGGACGYRGLVMRGGFNGMFFVGDPDTGPTIAGEQVTIFPTAVIMSIHDQGDVLIHRGKLGIGISSLPTEALEVFDAGAVKFGKEGYLSGLDSSPRWTVFGDNLKVVEDPNYPGVPQFVTPQDTPQEYGYRAMMMRHNSGIHFVGDSSATAAGAVVSPNYLMSLRHNGNVGIGTTNPEAKLEVVGQIKLTGGNPGEGKILTSDANGLASWQPPASSSTSSIEYIDASDEIFTQVTSPADMPTMSLTLTTAVGEGLLITVNISSAYHHCNNDFNLRLLEDGSEIARAIGEGRGENADTCESLNIVDYRQPSVGTHTYKVQWWSSSSAWDIRSLAHRSLIILRIK